MNSENGLKPRPIAQLEAIAPRFRGAPALGRLEAALGKYSTDRAPWYMIPAVKKWLRNHVVAELIVQALDEMKLKYPAPSVDISNVLLD